MKQFRWLLVWGFLSLGLAAPAMAGWVALGSGPGGFNAEVLSSDYSSTTIRFTLNGFESTQTTIEGRPYTVIKVPGLRSLDTAGMPELPKWNRNVMIPYSSSASVEVVASKVRDFQLGTITPSKGSISRSIDPANVPYVFSNFYGQDINYPAQVADVSAPFQMRDVRGVTLSIRPFQFNGNSGILRVTEELTVRINTKQENKNFALLAHRGPMDSSFAGLYAESFINFDAFSAEKDVQHLLQDTGKLLIIAHDSLSAALAPFVTWKRQKGIEVELVNLSSVGSTYTDIKNLIADRYHNNGISAALLVGDAELVPFHPGSAGNAYNREADPLYGTIDGNDSYPEVMISRFSAKDAKGLQTIVSKVVNYEKLPDLDGSWYSHAVGIASDEGTPTDHERADILAEMLSKWHYTTVDKLYDPGVTAAGVAKVINQGAGYINYIGHGSKTSWGTSGFSTSSINALTNGRKLPFIVSVACVNGQFAGSGESFAERWLLAGTPDAPKGAVAILASSTNQAWVPPTVGQQEITRLLTSEKMDTIGMLYTHGLIAVLEDASEDADQTFQTWHTFGDATMQVRTRAPSDIPAQLDSVLAIKNGKVTINAGAPGIAAGITVGDELVGHGKSGTDNLIDIQFNRPVQNGEQITVTLTGFNRIPSIKTLVAKTSN